MSINGDVEKLELNGTEITGGEVVVTERIKVKAQRSNPPFAALMTWTQYRILKGSILARGPSWTST